MNFLAVKVNPSGTGDIKLFSPSLMLLRGKLECLAVARIFSQAYYLNARLGAEQQRVGFKVVLLGLNPILTANIRFC
jgi:hypothetical protein